MRIGRFLILTLINAVFVTPALARPVIDYQAMCEQMYPTPEIAAANCENYGAGNPYTSYGYLETNANPGARVANRRPFHNRRSARSRLYQTVMSAGISTGFVDFAALSDAPDDGRQPRAVAARCGGR